jgi:hypothetical protein
MEVQESSALAIIETFTAVDLFKPGAMDDVLTKIEAEVRSAPKDISTDKGRKAIAALAHKVARSKTFIEEQRIELVSGEKKRLAAIDAEGKKMRDRLDALKIEARAPLTAWENAEKDRIANHEANITAMELAGTLDFGASIDTIKGRITIVSSVDLSDFQEFKDRATQTKTSVLSGLETKLKIAEKQAADALEMEKLRKEAAERETRDREARIAQEAREKAQRESEAERVRIEAEKYAAEDRAKQAEAERAEAVERAQRAAAEAKAREVAQTKQAEIDCAAAVEAEKARAAAETKRLADETKAREKDKEHKKTINIAAVDALVSIVPEDIAKKIVTAIAKGLIPNVKIFY